ncbi:hypothetical protein NA57DRAFT_72012 [Rhizodiscina lignyota]|uniref:F-box domain-containing protein n=1 Tax=Rhizodiscina lignyota TaxID=1504668 RepID=A0A9P4MEX4_9PEZI|nr:hypothetical protein NA57DRAFT_72012 [Rhizodiscina lignyota]
MSSSTSTPSPIASNDSTLLSLPRELRDLIYHHLLHSTSKPPVSEPPPLESFRRFQSTTSWWGIHRFAPLESFPHTHGLLLTCKLLRAETVDAIALATSTKCCVDPGWHWHGYSPSVKDPVYYGPDGRRKEQKERYFGVAHDTHRHDGNDRANALEFEMDVIMHNERRLLPMWTRLPCIPPHAHFPLLRVNFRIFGDRGGKESAWKSSNGYGGSLGDMYFALLDLFLTFLERGPDYLSPPKGFPYQKPITIGNLELNVLKPEVERRPVGGYIYDDGDTRYGMIAPEFVAEGVELGVHVVLGTTEYAEAVVPRVGRVRLCLDGKERYVWDVEEMRRRRAEDA